MPTRLDFGTAAIACLFHLGLFHAAFLMDDATAAGPDPSPTATAVPAEGPLEVFLNEPFFQKQILFNGDGGVREPYLAVAVDGTVLALRNRAGHLRRSEDGGKSWGDIIEVPFGFLDSNMIVDENTGDILSVRLWDGTDRLWRSADHGKTWNEEEITLKPNEVMKWLQQTGLKQRATREVANAESGTYFLHANASESGITLRHAVHRGRLLVTATFRPHAEAHPSDRESVDAIYSCAIYSDDGGATWQVSGLFPEGHTEEAGLAELHDGRIYYNSRSHRGYHDPSLRRELQEEDNLRRIAWSYDGGQTWEDLAVSRVLPDGGGYDRGYGMKGGLVRLPVKNRDILIYSNTDTGGGAREMMTVWASFDGGTTWPVKRLVFEGPSAYSTLAAGRPSTASEGQIYLLFEGAESHHYDAMQLARFNLAWLLEGALTGDGEVPQWVRADVPQDKRKSGAVRCQSDVPQWVRADVPQRPNIVLIMSDDQGHETVGAYGAQTYRTPRLDTLAETGIRFDYAHATPVCTPTRLKIMSGKYNSRNYVGFGQMDPAVYTFGNLFQDAGYATFVGGKWQLAAFDDPVEDLQAPHHFGFDEYCLWQLTRTPRHGTRPPPRYPNPGLAINGEKVDFDDGQYGPDIVVDHIKDFIDRQREKPFFVYYPMILPHWPFEPTPDSPTWDPTRRAGNEIELRGPDSYEDNKYFVDMVEYTDKLVGRIVDHLEKRGLRENTLVIFTSDNGTERGLVSELNGQQIIGAKLHSTDAGTHVPMIANWPGVIEAGGVNNDLICFTYFFPTLAEVAGIEIPEELVLDGQSFAPVLYGNQGAQLRDWLYMWWYRDNDPDRPGDEFARTHRYKYYVDGRFYDVCDDPLEQNPIDVDEMTPEQRQIRDRLRLIITERTRVGFYARSWELVEHTIKLIDSLFRDEGA